jgi:hypothetical protein
MLVFLCKPCILVDRNQLASSLNLLLMLILTLPKSKLNPLLQVRKLELDYWFTSCAVLGSRQRAPRLGPMLSLS